METIWDLQRAPWDHSPRFYSPGQHPATARLVAQLQLLEARGFGASDVADYIREQIALFEQGESDAKARYDLMLKDRR